MPDPLTVIVALILVPFVYIFGRATYLEIRRYVLYGPSENKRALFPIDEDAPSYEAPPEDGPEDADPDPDAPPPASQDKDKPQ